ncbi:hypothetical protein IQ06DRAFT_361887 [Phaeosphaeriaceae sp. SRC1lsM3a]|nr:hypothetical protein IQ06DRAFT_361887 [Stagonospora sp. SRC1lsM3a]
MARRFRFGDHESGSEPSAPGPAPVGGIVKFQASRKSSESSWRPSKTSAMQAHSSEQNVSGNLVAESVGKLQSLGLVPDPSHSSAAYDASDMASTIKPEAMSRLECSAPPARNDTGHRSFTLLGNNEDSEISRVDTDVNDQYTELFGKLPDPIRLHEQTGEFDGQVIFIGHPNRDVSAHQWSVSSFQWVNIGRYAHARGRVEGSLASDQVQGPDAPSSTLHHFKLAAKDREKVILEAERSEEATVTSQPALPNAAHVDIASSAHPVTHDSAYHYAKTKNLHQLRHTIKKETLDDPFVVNTPHIQARLVHSVAKGADAKGSLDFEYKFPEKGPTARIQARIPTASAVHTREPPDFTSGVRAGAQFAHSSLREIDVGEEASSHFPSLVGQNVLPRRVPDRSYPGAIGIHAQLTNQLTAGGEYLKYMDARGQGRTAMPRFQRPFFTGSKPTTNDPTASLSVQVSEDEKLRSWFHDGHRPARQREYAMMLVSAASNASKCKRFGAIGEVTDHPMSCRLKNTRPFVCLYENLTEYVEEYRNGSCSYFNRAWKPAPEYLRDMGPDGNNSFFSK